MAKKGWFLKLWDAAPGGVVTIIFAGSTFIGICLYWIFGTNDLAKMVAFLIWIIAVAVIARVASLVDLAYLDHHDREYR